MVTVRNIGSVLEILLQRLRLEPGAHYAISSTARYLIIGIGTVSIFNLLGFSWSKLQWLVAALGVGLGFGLQEIVANFVSGLIILYERPIRIGDTVTVGEVTGVVSDIQIRATTLTDYDRRDVLIPNKNFITQQVINWTLSDPTTRLLLTVGVAYGTDPEKAQFVILEAVKSCPKVLREPAPSVVFSTFSASSLDFEVVRSRGTMDDRLPLRHDINAAIAKALKDAGIEIPFPQQGRARESLLKAGAAPGNDLAGRTRGDAIEGSAEETGWSNAAPMHRSRASSIARDGNRWNHCHGLLLAGRWASVEKLHMTRRANGTILLVEVNFRRTLEDGVQALKTPTHMENDE